MTRRKVEYVGSEAEKQYITNSCLTEAYQSFAKYWRRYAYTEVIEWIEMNSQSFNASELRFEFLEEEEEP